MYKNIFKITTIIIFILTFGTINLFSESNKEIKSDELFSPKFTGWKQAETEHFRFIYENASKETAEGFALIADDAWNKIAKIYSIPQNKSDIFVTGRTNTVNAYTYFSPLHIEMFTSPVISPTFTFREDWKKLFFTHELIHLANSSFEDRKSAKIFKKIVGPFGANIDLINVNGWALEGLTTVLETELTDGGRGRSPYYELMYKAPTLDNAFISYSNIGKEKEPPHGQNYVMGYLIMRSIADNYGIQALADIERNRSLLGSWEDSVELVTGKSAQEIYTDVRIALSKKYCDERKIPEGQIISPRSIDTNYYNPLIVFDDGTLLCLRTAKGMEAAIVKLDPAAINGYNYLEKTKPEKDLNSVYQETILFSDGFPTSDCATADENGTIYTTLYKKRGDKNPGESVEYPLYKWTKDEGLKQLTSDSSFYQPTVSRNGTRLIAVQQKGLNMRLVSVDLVDGTVKSILEKENFSFIQPSLNDDGTKLTFLILDGKKASVAVAEVSNLYNYKIIANNDDEEIYDPAYPHWNSNGNILFTCNYRGRLETFEVIESVDQEISINPVVSDPIGVLWSYQCEKGVIYSSFASTGYVLKIQPNEQWGQTPDFEGPSPAGQIICFGELMDDFPDFNPYPQLSQIEEIEEEETEFDTEETSKETNYLSNKKPNYLTKIINFTKSNNNSTKDTNEPIPVKGKKVKHRSTENIQIAENASYVQPQLLNEKSFIQIPTPVLYMPVFDIQNDFPKNEITTGFGAVILSTSPMLQRNFGVYEANLLYYPGINNIGGGFNLYVPFGILEVGLFVNRQLASAQFTKEAIKNIDSKIPYHQESLSYFYENNTVQLGLSLPLINISEYRNSIDLNLSASILGTAIRYNATPCSINSNTMSEYVYSVDSNIGLDLFLNKNLTKYKLLDFTASSFAYAYYDFDYKNIFFGGEGDSSFTYKTNKFQYQIGVRGRYFPFPAEKTIKTYSNKYAGEYLNCSSSTIIIPNLSLVIQNVITNEINLKLYTETLFRNTNSKTLSSDNSIGIGSEFFYSYGRYLVAFGTSQKLIIANNELTGFNIDNFVFYFSAKFNFERL